MYIYIASLRFINNVLILDNENIFIKLIILDVKIVLNIYYIKQFRCADSAICLSFIISCTTFNKTTPRTNIR